VLYLWIVAALGWGCTSGKPPKAQESGCNGHPELCERSLDRVTLAGTHNSMSNEDEGWLAPNQGFGIERQLNDGIRAMMLDAVDWEGEPYLCHGPCELGAEPLADGLAKIESFLVAQPGQVVVVIFQDALSVETMVEVMEAVGLSRRVWTWDGETVPLPTLGALIDAETNLVILGESGHPPPAWYHHAWDLVTDTPYDFRGSDDFSCDLYRGESSNPLFLVNHWVSRPLPDAEMADVVNQAEILGDRARSCGEERGRRVNILAVDHYDRGDLFLVVDQLNGLAP
jgi:hypothetical protein